MASRRRTLQTANPQHLQLGMWRMPALDELDAAQRRRFHALANAIRHYLEEKNLSKHLKEHRIHPEVFYRAFDRCLALDQHGEPLGFVGLLPHLEVKPRRRRAPIEPNGYSRRGLAGALELFLRTNSDLCAAFVAYIEKNAKRKPGGEAGIRHKSVHIQFLKLCEERDPTHEKWPFTSKRRAAGAVREFVCRYINNNYDKIVATQFGDKAGTKSRAGTGHDSRLLACMPFDIVELDEHTAGFIGSVVIETPEGQRVIDAGRVTILLMVDRYKNWILAFKVIFRDAANSDDVLDVVHAAMVGEPAYAHWKADQASVRPLVELDSRFSWCGFNCLLLDNALIHLANEVVSRVMGITGCVVNFGPVHTPARRQLVERIFNALERAGFRRLQTTTGSGPLDSRRQDPEVAARRARLTEGEIVKLISDLIWKFNQDCGKHNLAASAYQRMQSLVAGEEAGKFIFPFLPPLQDGEADLSKMVLTVPVVGNRQSGRRPYFTFLEADYTSPELAKRVDLIGKRVVLHVTRSNIRTIPAFHGGHPLGTCMAMGRWHWSDHTIDLRRYINQLIRAGYCENDLNCDVVATFQEGLGKAASTQAKAKAAKPSVRQWGDHSTRREPKTEATGSSSIPEAAQAVNELLSRASEDSFDAYVDWDDIGALGQGDHEN